MLLLLLLPTILLVVLALPVAVLATLELLARARRHSSRALRTAPRATLLAMGDPTRRPAVIPLKPARAESSASMALTTPAVIPLHPARARSSASIELSVSQPQEVVLEHAVVRAGARIHVEGEKVTRRRLPRPSWGDLGIAGAAASIAGPVGSLIAGRQAGELCALIGASVFGIRHYAQRL